MTPAHRRPTIVDVAHAAGVSKSLVSAALRGDPGVSQASRDLILATADSLGYRRNGWAQRLVSGRSELVGVLLTDLRNAYQTDVVNGVEDAARDAGFGVILSHGRRDRALLRERLAGLISLGVDAVIAVTGHLTEDDLCDASSRVPLVVVGRPPSVPADAGWISNDDETGARLALRHLIDAGHERIAHLYDSDRPAASARRAAYRSLATPPREYDSRDGGIEALLDAMTGDAGPTAVFAAHDRLAARLIADATARGVRVPADLAVVGYDNTDLADLMRITSVDQPRQRMGADAMAMALALAAGEAPTRVVAAPTLILRDSSRSPA